MENPAAPAFKSRPDLLPPTLQVSVLESEPQTGLVLITPSALPTNRGISPATQIAQGLGQPGAMILDEHGRTVWFQPTNGLATNLQVQSYGGEPVLTYWEGTVDDGIGFGTGYILDSSYREVATVRAANGLMADLHELTLTPEGTALITAYDKRAADLTSVKGPKNGTIWDSIVQEIDVKTGKLLMEWRSLDHVAVSESYLGYSPGDFDYFHVNSVSLYGSDELLVSSRNTWALYRLDRSTGTIVARINGKSSDYKMGPATNFYWQHHSRLVSPGTLTVFDDGATPDEEPRSRGLVHAVDDTARTVRLTKAFTHPANLLTPYEGSMQLLSDGGAFIGFGGQPYFSQFAADGKLVYNGRFPTNDQSYRAFRSPWVGTPAEAPSVALEKDTLDQTVVYVSWNGSTEVRNWQVLSGKTASDLEVVAESPKSGFETAISTRPSGPLLAVAALDANGTRLALTKPIAALT
ncbi:MAG TPA: arylsulfotransferase family protein [Acidimicrobiales bacterium]|nr:arylsulfotransferase family protein [Acidimicrobiales bacterium]